MTPANTALTLEELREARRIHDALKQEIEVLTQLNAQLNRRIRDARFRTKGALSLKEGNRHDPAVITPVRHQQNPARR